MSWLLVPEDAIVLHHRARDKKAAFRLRDYHLGKSRRAGAAGRQKASQSRLGSWLGLSPAPVTYMQSLSDASAALCRRSGILCAPTPECCGPIRAATAA